MQDGIKRSTTANGKPKRGKKQNTLAVASRDLQLKIPFIVVKTHHEENAVDPPIILHRKKLKLTSVRPLKCYGDWTIMSKINLLDNQPSTEAITDAIGPLGVQIPDIFKRIDEQSKHFLGKYKQ